jgi:hypothetical protein
MTGKRTLWFFFAILFSASAAWAGDAKLKPCGLKGTIEKRIKSCQRRNHASAETKMKLVTVTKARQVIKMDATGLLWGDTLPTDYLFEDAMQACNYVSAADGYPVIEGMSETWRMPTIDEYARIGVEIERIEGIHGDQSWNELPNTEHYFWTGSSVQDHLGLVFAYFAGIAFAQDPDQVGAMIPEVPLYRVRCVVRP